MKAISVKQPWANMISRGLKSIETRTWETTYRGELLIVSSKRPKIYPAGAILCLATLVDCRSMQRSDEPAAGCDWYEGAFAWLLENIRKVIPIEATGRLGIYDLDITLDDLEFIPPRSSDGTDLFTGIK